MPVFDGKYYSGKEHLTNLEKKWVEILYNFSKNKELQKKYSRKSKKRAEDFKPEKMAKEYQRVLDNL